MLQEIQAHGPESLEKQLQFNGLPFVLSGLRAGEGMASFLKPADLVLGPSTWF